ncbi:condensation domain-containing protein [Novispirillum sp. DQ9]|uniref:condensation domain-containing protein n=1 Tax=Novispirillum sp. DQ9 TaxID=3398612 RepID=UPI003C7A32C5
MPLTLGQLDFWEEFTLNPGRPLSTVAHCLDFRGPLDHDAMVRAVSRTAREADILSVRFHVPAGAEAPVQHCDPARAPLPRLIDLRDHADPPGAARALMQADVDAYLDLRDGPVVEQWLLRVGDDRCLWYFRGHHIILDGYAMMLLEQRCARLYAHHLGHGEAGPPFHPFASYIAEEARYRAGPRFEADRLYWRASLERGRLPSLRKDQEGYGGGGLHHECALAPAISRRLSQMAGDTGIGWPDLLVLLSAAYLYRTLPAERAGGGALLPLWLPLMGRWGSISAFMPAMVVNILPLWVDVAPAETLGAFLRRQGAALRDLRAHGRYRIEQIATDQGLDAGSRYFFSPLVNVVPFDPPRFEGCQVAREVLSSGYGDGFNITYRGRSDGGDLVADIDADAALTGTEEFRRHQQALPIFLARALESGALDSTVTSLCR